MAFLPSSPLILTGGCLCSAVRYSITIPALSSRPLVPGALPTPANNPHDTAVDTRLPLIGLDHCNSCRRSCGGLLQCWFICPQSWVEFKLQPRQRFNTSMLDINKEEGEGVVYPTSSIVTNPPKEVVEATYLGYYPSSPNVHRCFCMRCGTGLTGCSSRDRGPGWTLGEIVDIAVGSLDRESIEVVRPDRHGWWEVGVEWIRRLVSEGDGGSLIKHPGESISEEVRV